ncbi:MAG: thioredoxin family protein [Cryomorphaceae bacterium]|nr:thioredoxin family protein [Cryomorphaceae bacterium]
MRRVAIAFQVILSSLILFSCQSTPSDKEVVRDRSPQQMEANQTIGFYKHMSLDDALELARQENKQVFIDFYADWCAPCKMMERDVFTNQSVYTFFNERFINVKMDVDDRSVGSEAAAKYNVSAMPTLMLIDPEKDVIMKERGYRDANGLLKAAQSALARANY